MCSVSAEKPAPERARWLSELSEALNAAHHLLVSLDVPAGQSVEARELYLRIEAARLEVQSLRLRASLKARKEKSPEWSEILPWQRGSR